MAYYLDTAAAVKLVVAEQGSTALARWVRSVDTDLVGSDLLRTELLRAVRRAEPKAVTQARELLDSLILLTLPTSVFERAAFLEPSMIRSLDALHLSVAMELGDELDGIVTYDERLADAAHALGIVTVSPR
ncbi:MAG: type II toxin-antitoxin system VapC family toxin [Acidimicrobiales bacterium]